MQLLTKFTIGGNLELKNRVCLAPLTRARCTPTKDPLDPASRIPNEIMADYYSQRAASGGLVVTEATSFSEAGYGWRNAAIIDETSIEGWKNVNKKVHDNDGVIFIQLWHMGRQMHSSFNPSTNSIFAPSAIAMPKQKTRTTTGEDATAETPVAMTEAMIEETIRDYVKGAQHSKQAGFDGLEIHAANGYLIDTFLQASTNTRNDAYGGSKEKRFTFLKRVLDAIIEDGSYPASRIAVRLSPNGAYGDMGSESNVTDFPYFASELNKYGLAYLHVMDGLGFGYHEKCPVVTTGDIRREFSGPIMANVGLTKDMAEGLVRSGTVDLCAFGRLYISNPDLPKRFENDWPVEPEAPYETWWQPTGAKGYSDWPAYEAK